MADQQEYRVSELGYLCQQLGYKPRELLRSEQTGDWYQWWYLPKKYNKRPKDEPATVEQGPRETKFSARREGLVPMKG